MTDFEKFGMSQGISSINLYRYSNIIAPSVLESSKNYMSSYDIFSRLLKDRIIFLTSAINDDVASIIQAQLLYLASLSDDDISLYINTPGGIVSSGLGIYDTMQLVKPDVSTVCIGMAASMGSVILAGGAKNKRFALPNSSVMIHQPLGGAFGQASDIIIEAEEIKKCREKLYKIISKHTSQEVEKIAKDADRDYWMTSKEAMNYGIIDSIKG